jgi:hypothetical protein
MGNRTFKVFGSWSPAAHRRAGSGIFAGMEYLPAALAAREELAKRPTRFPSSNASPPAYLGATLYPPYPSSIVQDGSFVVIMYEFAHDVRIIR